jgi:hypothetical protein
VIEAGSLEYAHARLCARYGNRPDELVWRRVEMIREFAALLDAARASPLAAWLPDIGPQSDVHAIERALRAELRSRVRAISGWMPPAWRPSLDWCAVLVDLPVLQHLARGGLPPPWLHDDPAVAGTPGTPHPRRADPLAAGAADPDRLAALWRAEWRRRLPARRGGSSLLADFARLVAAHAALFRNPLLADGWAQRRALHARLAQMFRRATLDPAAAFIFLALSALDGERLRGELVRRAAFPRLPLAS